MANKALVIDVSQRSQLNGVLDKWEPIGNMSGFTRDIETPKLDENADKSAIVSGIPTVFARANMFNLALSYSGDSMSNASASMISFYNDLVDEWFGLITCIALDSGKLSIRRIDFGYSDGKSIAETSNIYEPKGAFGNLLFERAQLWTEQTEEHSAKNPFINVIKYNNQVVGGTSPECLLFTAPSYKVDRDPRYAPEGKFVNPVTKGNIGGKDWLALYAYVKNLIERLNNDFTSYYQSLEESIRPNYTSISKRLQLWLDEIKKKIQDDVEKATANPVTGFTSPFSLIFNYSDDLYGFNGSINSKEVPGYTPFKAEELLLPRTSEIARIVLGPQAIEHYSELPIQLLEARIKGGDVKDKAYFALPLSVTGLKIFGSSITALVRQQGNTAIKSLMTAEFDPNLRENNLTVFLTIITEDGKTKNVVMVYSVKNEHVIKKSDILLWPNFISNQWNRYFMYSELPSGVSSMPFNAVPFVGGQENGNFVPIMNEDGVPVYLTDEKRLQESKGINSKLLVTSDHRVADSQYKYEIYESNKPFSGVKLTNGTDREGHEKVSGFLLIRYASGNDSSRLPKNLLNVTTNFKPKGVFLGFDFGSTNSSVAFFDQDNEAEAKGQGLLFKNHRISLFGSDNIGKHQPKDFFFFPALEKPILSNALKSILTIHDQRRMPSDNDVYRKSPISGGVPCFIRNLPIRSVTSNTISLDFGDGVEAQLINNMKWSDTPIEKAYKTAYLKTLLLMVYAELFEMGLKPVKLNWSYPSTMEWSMVSNHYDPIWKDLGGNNVSPIKENGNLIPLEVMNVNDQTSNRRLDGIGIFDTPFGSTANVNDNSSFGNFESNPFGNPFGDNSMSNDTTNSSMNGKSFDDLFAAPTEEVQNDLKTINLQPESPMKKLEFGKVETDKPMTEACASANYTAQTAYTKTKLVLCFDVGGSTTDISALYELEPNKPTMIKQNSIRFAAQNVSKATKAMSEQFKCVLTTVCNKFNIKLIGFNIGVERYNADTAPYYYEQMVDLLDPKQLEFFYQCIAELCPRLFAVNMYVTGLIMFYAGQLSRTLIDAVRANIAPGLPFPQGFQPVFEGKGARIFDWLSTKNYTMSETYFKTMFIAGTNSQMNSAFIDLSNLKNESSNDVKFEVSKGLARPNGTLRQPKEAFEIFGENGFKGYGQDGSVYEYDFATKLTPEWMQQIGVFIRQDSPRCECFERFCSIYYNAVHQILGLDMDLEEFKSGLRNMNIEQYVTQDLPRFQQAMERCRNNTAQKFDYVAPIIIIEGMKFYDKHLLKCFK